MRLWTVGIFCLAAVQVLAAAAVLSTTETAADINTAAAAVNTTETAAANKTGAAAAYRVAVVNDKSAAGNTKKLSLKINLKIKFRIKLKTKFSIK